MIEVEPKYVQRNRSWMQKAVCNHVDEIDPRHGLMTWAPFFLYKQTAQSLIAKTQKQRKK